MTTDNATRQTITLVKFDYDDTGTPASVLYNNGPTAVTASGIGTFASLPEMSVEMPKIDGLIEDNPAQIYMRSVAPLDVPASGEPFPVVTATIYLADPTDVSNTIEVIFSGTVTKLLDNADGVPGVLRAYVSGWRNYTKDRIFGLSATTSCLWSFGDRSCGKDSSAFNTTGIITDIWKSYAVTDIDYDAIATVAYSRGHLRRGGLYLMIREATYAVPSDPFFPGTLPTYKIIFKLNRKAPQRWLNQQANVLPGCVKTIDACRFWNNEERFGGCGIAIPATNPLYGGL